jgi:hypothetical protein
MTKDYTSQTATLLDTGQVLVTGEENADLYDPQSGKWSFVGPMLPYRTAHTATVLPTGQVLIAGGRQDEDTSAELYTSGEPRPLLTIHVPDHLALSHGPLIVGLITAARADVVITLRVQGARNMVVYRASLRGTADAHGRFTGTLRIAYLPNKPVQAALMVTVQAAHGTVTRTMTVTLVH